MNILQIFTYAERRKVKVISKFGKRTASITLIFIVCITMLFSGSGVSKVFAEEPTKPDVEVSNLKAAMTAPDGSFVSFDLKINHKVSKGETVTLGIGYDKVDPKDSGPYIVNFAESPITTASGEVVGTVEANRECFTLTFNDEAEKYDQLKVQIKANGIFDVDSLTKDSNGMTLDLPIYMKLKNSDGTYSKIEGSDGLFKREINPVNKRGDELYAFSAKNDATVCLNLGDKNLNNLRDGNFEVNIPEGMEVQNIKSYHVPLFSLTKPGNVEIYGFNYFSGPAKSFSLYSNDGNKVIFKFEKDKLKDCFFERLNLKLKYKDGFSYTENPYREVKADLTGIGGGSYTRPIKNGEITAGGTGTILDVSKYDLTADPIIVHKGDKAPDNNAICDKVTIKDKADGKTVTAEEIGADKTRTDSNVIDTNKPGDYSATVTVQYKDKSVKNVAVPIKVIDNVIPVKPDKDGKNPEKPAGYVTVTMDPTANGHLAENEASQYYVNPEKEVTIPAKDAIGNVGYKFKEWKPAFKGTFKEDTTITAQYANIDDVIPVKPGEDGKTPEKPAGYVTVTMDPTANGHLAKDEASKYYVNPEKEVTIPAKDAIGNVGYKFTAWDKSLKGIFKEDNTITAQYNKLPDVIPNVPDENGNKPTKPDGYVTIKVDPGENGKLDPRDSEEYFVNPNKDVLIPLHDAIGNTGYKFSKWNPNNKGRFSKDMTIKAEYMKKKNITPLTGDTEMLLSYTVLLAATAGIVIGFRRKRNAK